MVSKRPGIYGFDGPYRFLSNFYIESDGTHVEGEYQRAKCANWLDRTRFEPQNCTTPLHPPNFCKALGRKVKLRKDWEELDPKEGLPIKVAIMLFYVCKKFKDHPSLREQLQLTAMLGLYLEKTNHWGDTYWGVCQGRGLNMLGAILMQVRGEL